MPHVSVIIPAYNRPELLQEAIVSCLLQTLQDIEVIVVDDGSEADLRHAIEQARACCPSRKIVRYVRQERAGAPAARNRGFRESCGEFIQFLDSDDLLHPQKLELQVAELERDGSLDMIYCLDEWFKEQIGDMGVLWAAADDLEPLDQFAWFSPTWSTNSPVWRRRAVEKIGGWEEKLQCLQDWEFHVRALCAGIRYAHTPEVLQFDREHQGHRVSCAGRVADSRESELRAVLLAASHLRRAHSLTRWRADGLAKLMLQISDEMTNAGRIPQARKALWHASLNGRSAHFKLIARLMLVASYVAQCSGKSPASAQNRVRGLLERFAPLPQHGGAWQSVQAPPGNAPQVLVEAIKNLRRHYADKSDLK